MSSLWVINENFASQEEDEWKIWAWQDTKAKGSQEPEVGSWVIEVKVSHRAKGDPHFYNKGYNLNREQWVGDHPKHILTLHDL